MHFQGIPPPKQKGVRWHQHLTCFFSAWHHQHLWCEVTSTPVHVPSRWVAFRRCQPLLRPFVTPATFCPLPLWLEAHLFVQIVLCGGGSAGLTLKRRIQGVLHSAQHRYQNQKWLPNPYRLRGPKMSNGYITPAFSGVPNAQRGYQNRKWLLNTGRRGGTELGHGYITPALSGVPKAQRGQQKQKWGGTTMTPRWAEIGHRKKARGRLPLRAVLKQR